MVLCPRCEPMEPQILIATKVGRMCATCGNGMIDVTERISPPPEAFTGYSEDGKKDKDKDKSALDDEPAPGIVDTAEVFADIIQEKGEVVEVMEPPAKILDFEEVDHMDGDEIARMVNKLGGLNLPDGTGIEEARTAIKTHLAVENVLQIEKG